MSYYHKVISQTKVISEHGYDFNACNNVRNILYNTDIINSIVSFVCVCVCVRVRVCVCVCVRVFFV